MVVEIHPQASAVRDQARPSLPRKGGGELDRADQFPRRLNFDHSAEASLNFMTVHPLRTP